MTEVRGLREDANAPDTRAFVDPELVVGGQTVLALCGWHISLDGSDDVEWLLQLTYSGECWKKELGEAHHGRFPRREKLLPRSE